MADRVRYVFEVHGLALDEHADRDDGIERRGGFRVFRDGQLGEI